MNNKNVENSHSDLIDKIDAKLKEVNPDYKPPSPVDTSAYDDGIKHTTQELLDRIDERLKELKEKDSSDNSI